ncbi:MAG: ribosome assembly factor SBDS [Candidatus Altiarchaeota archaeon]
MVDINKASVIKLKISGENFEVLVDPDLAFDYRSGKNINIERILAIPEIFKDAKIGDKASLERMKQIFGTDDILKIADIIIKKGEFSLTTEQRRKILEEKRRQIINIIARNAIDPKTKLPHPPKRIEIAMEEAKVSIDFRKSAEEQVEDVVRAIRPLLPIKFETIKLAVKIPVQYYNSCYKKLREISEIQKEEWSAQDYLCLVELPAGLQDEFYSSLNSLTHGEVKIKILEKEDVRK